MLCKDCQTDETKGDDDDDDDEESLPCCESEAASVVAVVVVFSDATCTEMASSSLFVDEADDSNNRKDCFMDRTSRRSKLDGEEKAEVNDADSTRTSDRDERAADCFMVSSAYVFVQCQ